MFSEWEVLSERKYLSSGVAKYQSNGVVKYMSISLDGSITL